MATKIVTKNSSTASAVPTASDLLQGELAVNVADKRLFTEDNAGAIVELGTNPSTLTVTGEITASGGIALGDNDKATFGAGDDLQIYHTGSYSAIADVGTGAFYIGGADFVDIGNSTLSETSARFHVNDRVDLYHNNAIKLATTASGISVTGTATMDGLTVDGTGVHINLLSTNASENYVWMKNTEGSAYIGQDAGVLQFWSGGNTGGVGAEVALKIDGNNDISFYEDTGTTPKFFWDASAESLGIGSAAASSYGKFLVEGTGNLINANASSGAATFQLYEAGQGRFAITTLNGSAGAKFLLAGTERMRIESDGNVRINDSLDNITGTLTLNGRNTGNIIFQSGGTEKMRLSGGNLLVGTTSSSSNTAGIKLSSAGTASFVRSGVGPVYVNRLTNDGDLAVFAKDGDEVGSIGAISGDLAIYSSVSGHNGLRLALGAVLPTSNAGVVADNSADLGSASYRFKDLYLSGGVYLGGTGAANTLDDYESGTWTPTQGTFTTWTSPTFTAEYTKIGRMVQLNLRQTGGTVAASSGAKYIAGLPFTPATFSAGTVSHGGVSDKGSCVVSGSSLYFTNTLASENDLIATVTYYV